MHSGHRCFSARCTVLFFTGLVAPGRWGDAEVGAVVGRRVHFLIIGPVGKAGSLPNLRPASKAALVESRFSFLRRLALSARRGTKRDREENEPVERAPFSPRESENSSVERPFQTESLSDHFRLIVLPINRPERCGPALLSA